MSSLEALEKITTSIGAKIKIEKQKEKLTLVMTCVVEEEEKYSFFINKNTLHVQSIKVPRYLIKKMFPGRIIMLSGTLMNPDLQEFLGSEKYVVCDLQSPIPKENRPVLLLPTPFRLNKAEMNYQKLVEDIESDILAFCPTGNVLVHVTYEMSERMLEYWTLPKIITHDKKNKEEKLQRFISRGGIFVAAGCEEGLDLKGDLCHLNIIAKVRWPNLGDPWVQKRRAYYGNLWYLCETLKTVIQSAGRSTRSATDRSLIIIKDPSFSALRDQTRTQKQLPGWFEESIISLKARKVKNEFSRIPYEGNGPVRDEVYQAVWPKTKREPKSR
jgi:Rad3-related DNA helicase